ncbi:uncharacterized protein EDB91DRAFT_1244003 [Suillus paluster]|uniref:uncharacterized protein n=1 Tax=Suillus paluster TaxID=48578 RepID=UPI001B8851CF|nr:uncharacterized protein EDB91DRAFT_1244003 [Suillus paluster]KAG1750425.1 hypothetical protein EDB91DRAFT_1244003 [Suillus paluster]
MPSLRGMGKTSVAKEIARRFESDERVYASIHYIDFSPLSFKPSVLSCHLFVLARWHSPSILVFDNLEKSDARPTPSDFRGIVFLVTAEPTLLHMRHVFKDVASIPLLGRDARKEILSNLVSRRRSMAKKPLPFNIDEFDPLEHTRLAEGYSHVDLRDLVTRTIQVAVGRAVLEVTLSARDFVEAHEGFVPLSLRDVPLQSRM